MEFRGNQQSHAFQISLIRDPRFPALVRDIVVEFGNSRYQGVLDRFIQGDNVDNESLRRVWQDTTQVEYEWDLPIYEAFFRAVRSRNASLPLSRRLRVLLADPPINWENVHTLQDLHQAMGDRDAYAVDVIRREVLEEHRKALVIFGGQHLIRRNTLPGVVDEWASGLVARLEKDKLAKVFTVLPETRKDLTSIQPDIALWDVPSLAILHGTILGEALWDNRPNRRAVRTEDQAEAILYLGPPSSMTSSQLSPSLCSDPAYISMRTHRLSLVPPPLGLAFSLSDQLKQYCAAAIKVERDLNHAGHQLPMAGDPSANRRLGALMKARLRRRPGHNRLSEY